MYQPSSSEPSLYVARASSPVQFRALCDPMDCSTPGFTVHHQLPELTQTHVHQAGDAIQPSHPLSPPIPPTFNLSPELSRKNPMIEPFQPLINEEILLATS